MKIKVRENKKNEDRRRKDRYGHSVRRFTAKDLSVIPDIKITKIVPPTEEDVRKCAVTKNGKFVVFFDVDSESFKLEYNPHLEGYDGMRSAAREKCSIQNLATGQTWDCTGVYTLPEWITYGGHSDWTTDHLDDPAVQAFMNPSEQMVLTQFIKPFAKDYLGVDATESKKNTCSMSKKKESLAKKSESYTDYEAIQEWLESVMDKAGTMFGSAYVSDNRPGEIDVEIGGYDSTGGDATFSIQFDAGDTFEDTIANLDEELNSYAEDFNPDEEAQLWVGGRGAPSLRELIKAMDERKEDMRNLSDAVHVEYKKL